MPELPLQDIRSRIANPPRASLKAMVPKRLIAKSGGSSCDSCRIAAKLAGTQQFLPVG